jgi:hypothetical protein
MIENILLKLTIKSSVLLVMPEPKLRNEKQLIEFPSAQLLPIFLLAVCGFLQVKFFFCHYVVCHCTNQIP